MTTSSSSSARPALLALAVLPLLAAAQSLYGTLPFVDEEIQGPQVRREGWKRMGGQGKGWRGGRAGE